MTKYDTYIGLALEIPASLWGSSHCEKLHRDFLSVEDFHEPHRDSRLSENPMSITKIEVPLCLYFISYFNRRLSILSLGISKGGENL